MRMMHEQRHDERRGKRAGRRLRLERSIPCGRSAAGLFKRERRAWWQDAPAPVRQCEHFQSIGGGTCGQRGGQLFRCTLEVPWIQANCALTHCQEHGGLKRA